MADYYSEDNYYENQNYGQANSGFAQNINMQYNAENPTAYEQGYDNYNAQYDTRQFPQEPQFQSFNYTDPSSMSHNTGDISSMPTAPFVPSMPSSQNEYQGSIMKPDTTTAFDNDNDGNNFDDEPPLMEELGINFDHITEKTLSVLNPLKHSNSTIMQDTDLAGPLVFCLAFGATLLLAGKVHFGYIYGIGVVGSLAIYCLLNLMSQSSVPFGCILSVLGYCLLPMILLSLVAVPMALTGIIGISITLVAVLWSSYSASKLFVSALSMNGLQILIAYPCALLYAVFALITVF